MNTASVAVRSDLRQEDYTRLWGIILAVAAAGLLWIFEGRAFFRKHFWGVPPPAESERVSTQFVALAFPRISKDGERFSMAPGEFQAILLELRAKGYRPVGFSDIREFYETGRKLPPKAVLIALDRDNPDSVHLADRALRRARMKAGIFLNKTPPSEPGFQRRTLTAHAIKQMNKSGAWEFGWYADDGPPPKPWPEGPILDIDSKSAWASRMGAGPAFLFIGAKTGFNDHRQKLSELRMMKVRPDLPARDNVAMIEANWPRKAEFEDDFSSGSLGLDWMVVWGVISGSRNRMAIMPTPKQKSAAVFLTGTEDWRDMVLEFEIKKFRRSVWAHARYDEGRRYIRVGANHGWLHVQQKSSAESPPVTLAKEPLSAASFPARVRLILKDQWAIVYLNGRMRFGKGLPVDLGITHGRLQFSVYHSERWQALGVLNYVRAAPLGENWIAFRVISEHLSDGTYDALHEDAVFAKALSPQWIWIQSDGTIRVKVDEEQEELVRAISGFNRCALAPLTHFGLARLDAMRDPGSADRLYRNLLAKTAEMNLGGLNLRLPNEALERRDIRKFLRRLRAGLKEQNKGLWVTVNSRVEPDRELIDTVDGVLRPVRRAAGGGGELLQGYEPAEPGVTEGGSS